MPGQSIVRWNWQRPDWPNFTWSSARFAKAEERLLVVTGEFLGTVKHLTAEDKDQPTVESMSTEAVTTSEIEGEILDRMSVQSSIRRQLGLDADRRRVKPAEQGVAEMMVDLHRSFAELLSNETLFAWYRLLMGERRDLHIGGYRRHDGPMYIVN